ncbi:MAG: response regulator, partial [bacterium]
MKILIVDDSDLKISKIKTVINETDEKHEILIAKNKADAMILIKSNPLIDLMILDLNLPNRKGENAKRLAGLS